MSTESTNNEEAPKKRAPRKGSKAAIDAEMAAAARTTRIAELEEGYALAIANSEIASAARLRERITRLEQGFAEEAPDDVVAEGEAPAADVTAEPVVAAPVVCPKCTAPHPGADPTHASLMCPTCQHVWPRELVAAAQPTVTWNDVVKASADREASEWEWETSEEVIDVALRPEDMADLLRANGADEEAKDQVDRDIDRMKSDLKEKKAESEAIAARMKERNKSGLKGVQSKKAHWKVGTCFAVNTVRYVDPITERVVFERPIRADERQVALPLVSESAAQKAAQLSLGDVDPTEATDPEALLAAAQKGEADPADQPLDNDGSAADLGDDDDDDLNDDDGEESDE